MINILNEDHNGNYELRDVHPLETAGNGSVYIHRKADHYNGIVYRSARFVHASPSKELSFACPESSSVVTSIVSKTASGHYSPPSARSSGSATSHPPLTVHSPVPSMHHGRSAPPCCPSYDVSRPPSLHSSNFSTASDQRSDPSRGPSPWTSRPLSLGTSTFSMLSHGSSNAPRSSSTAPRPYSAVSSTLVMPSCGLIHNPCGPSSVAPRLLPTVASTAHHQRSAAFCSLSSAVPLPLSAMPPTLPTEYHGYVNTLCGTSPEKPRPPRLTYSFEHLNYYRDSVVSKQCNRDVRKRLFKLHL